MKAKVKKRVVSRKKPKKSTKSKSVSKSNNSNVKKPKKRVADSAEPVKQPLRPSTSKGLARNKQGKGGWPKGHSGNPKGRPKLGSTKLDNLLRTIRKVESDENVNVLEEFVKAALENDTTMIALMRKLYPDLKSIEQITIPGDAVSEQKAKDIRKKMKARFA